MSHGAVLRRAAGDSDLASHIMHDFRNAKIDSQTYGMLEFAEKLTIYPGSIEEPDVVRLRELGLVDEQILSLVLVVSKFNLLTRIANGLGVELSEGLQAAVEKWIVGPAKDQRWLMNPK